MGKKFFILLFLFLSPAFSSFAAQYEMNLSTYYPSPFGSYESLYLKPKSQPLGTPCKVGTLYFDLNGKFKLCQEDSTSGGYWEELSFWEESGNLIYLKETADNSGFFLGIGTETPQLKLHLKNDGGILAKGVFGEGDNLISAGVGVRMIWYPKKGAFRAGEVTGTEWDDDNIGNYSFAVGYNTIANNIAATAMGFQSTAMGMYSTAMGYQVFAKGEASTAMGYNTVALGNYSTAMGHSTIAGGITSTAFGYKTQATGLRSLSAGNETRATNQDTIAMGARSLASGVGAISLGIETIASGASAIAIGYKSEATKFQSIAIGNSNHATGLYAMALGGGCFSTKEGSFCMGKTSSAEGKFSISMGEESHTYADYSFGLGQNLDAQSYGSLVIGHYNLLKGNKTFWSSTDPLFVIANGQNDLNPSNAVTVLKNGNVGIGTDNPTASLSVVGVPEYAGNASALAGGLSVGSFYRTGDSLKVVY